MSQQGQAIAGREAATAGRPPVIMIGMHRSGTSLAGRLLGRLGLFSGAWKDENDEAMLFLELNKRLFRRAGARWDEPGPAAGLTGIAVETAARVRPWLSGPRAALFLGSRRYLRYRSLDRLDVPWGWKDPRNTYTLPVWLTIFPAARVLFIERHGVDVARSLEVRSARPALRLRLPWSGRSAVSARCAELEGGLSLWAEYQSQARTALAGLPAERVLRLRYEELLEQPAATLARAAEFCGLDAAESELGAAVAAIRAERAYAYRRDERLVAFARSHAATLAAWGYRDE